MLKNITFLDVYFLGGHMQSKDELKMEIFQQEVEVGGTYPIFGMITEIEEHESGAIYAQINCNIRAKLKQIDESKLEFLRKRAFESGIFVSTVTAKGEKIEVDCKTIIFGHRQAYNA